MYGINAVSQRIDRSVILIPLKIGSLCRVVEGKVLGFAAPQRPYFVLLYSRA
jgi:hypothetical protein